ncbi:MAG: hypothetical protein ABT20_10250 [Rubrivivax sp. SCN 70-15]|nr:MAG: hypothetical protein ABT20_10250 [Rubrivivax sp. SCN 70-15]
MNLTPVRSGVLLCLAASASSVSPARAADGFAARGAMAALTVEYVYESAGKKQDRIDLHEWRVRRMARLTADLVAQAPTPLPTMQPLDAGQTADLNAKAAKGQAAAAPMAPLMAGAEQIMARCGDDEACVTRETMKLGSSMSGTPSLNQAMRAGQEIEAMSRPGAPRYQAWRAIGQKGDYAIDERVHIVHGDPICMSLPRARCTRDESRQGAGAIPPPPDASRSTGVAAFELDRAKNTLTLMLPVPLMPMPYMETIVTDEPAGTHSVPTPRGPQARQLAFRTGAAGQPVTLPLSGGWRSQAGERVIPLEGRAGEGGTLTVRWRLSVP